MSNSMPSRAKADHGLHAYALWLVPSVAEAPLFEKVILDLARLEAQSPVFAPHITLFHPIDLGTPSLDVLKLLRQVIECLGAQGEGLRLALRPAQAGTFYYQSVLAPVRPDTRLSVLRKECETVWGSPSTPYFPHLSLLYGDLSERRREELAGVINNGGQLPESVHIAEVALVECVGTAQEWKVVGRERL